MARFKAIGLDQAAMEKWHRLFEQENPAGHESFQEWLGIYVQEARMIQRMSAES